MASDFQTAASVIMEEYKEALKRQIETPLFWDRHYPVDRRPVYGPPTPFWFAEGACEDVNCRCCIAWSNNWDEHYCY